MYVCVYVCLYVYFIFQIRSTNVQDNEEGGITQQIGATMVPRDAIQEQCKMVKNVCIIFCINPSLISVFLII